MYAKFYCPASGVTLLSKDGEGEIHPSSDIESQKSQLTLVELYFKIICYALDAEVRCPETIVKITFKRQRRKNT